MALFRVANERAQFDAASNDARDQYGAGIRFTQEGNARVTTSAGTFYNQGIPMSGTGQVAIVDATAGLPSGTIYHNGLPMSGDKVCVSKNATAVVSNGLPFDSAGALAADINFDLNFIGTDTLNSSVTFTRASTATYFDSAGVLQSAAINAPRFDYNPSTLAARGLLIEEQRTNIVASSVYTANANGWTNGVIGGTGTITAAAVNSPDGTTSGVFNISGLNGSSYVGNLTTTTSSTNARTGSVFVRNNGGVKFQIRLAFGTGGTFVSYGTEYDFNTGAFQDGIAGTTAPTSRSVTNVGNGWLRITITGSDNGTGNTQTQLLMFGAATTTNYNYLFWGAQVEQGASGASAAFPTSYIPTTTTALTRSADVANVNTLAPWYNATEGTLFVQAQDMSDAAHASNQPRAASLNDGTTSNRIDISRLPASAQVRASVFSGGASQFNSLNTAWPLSTQAKIALAYKAADFAACLGGGTVASVASGTVPTVSALTIGNVTTGGSSQWVGWIQRLTYYPRKLSSAELQAITA